ncbi:hypothetical protein [Ilumatobacter nonamiensis]|nr:hypothetical protein [Ilumatobacter nonamiensis]
MRKSRIESGSDPTYANVQVVINLTARFGMAAKITNDLPTLVGRPATPLV